MKNNAYVWHNAHKPSPAHVRQAAPHLGAAIADDAKPETEMVEEDVAARRVFDPNEASSGIRHSVPIFRTGGREMTKTYYCAECAKPIEVDTDFEDITDKALVNEACMAGDEDEAVICCSNACEYEYYLEERRANLTRE